MKKCTNHNTVAVTIPIPTQSTNIKYRSSLQNAVIPNLRNIENAMDDTENKTSTSYESTFQA